MKSLKVLYLCGIRVCVLLNRLLLRATLLGAIVFARMNLASFSKSLVCKVELLELLPASLSRLTSTLKEILREEIEHRYMRCLFQDGQFPVSLGSMLRLC